MLQPISGMHSKIKITTALCIIALSGVVRSAFEISVLHHIFRCNSSMLVCDSTRTGNVISATMDVLQPMPRMHLALQFFMRPGNSRQYQTISNVSQDFCDFLRNPTKNPWAGFFWTIATKSPGNKLFDHCPISVVLITLYIWLKYIYSFVFVCFQDRYFVKNLTINAHGLPMVWKNMRFNFSMESTMYLPEPRQAIYIEIFGAYRSTVKRQRN